MGIKGSTIDGLCAVVWMVLACVSWLTGREFMVGAICLLLGLTHRVLIQIEKLAERGR